LPRHNRLQHVPADLGGDHGGGSNFFLLIGQAGIAVSSPSAQTLTDREPGDLQFKESVSPAPVRPMVEPAQEPGSWMPTAICDACWSGSSPGRQVGIALPALKWVAMSAGGGLVAAGAPYCISSVADTGAR